MDPKLDRIMTVPEVAEYMQMSNSKVYYLIQRKEIPHIRVGRNVRIRESDLNRWIMSLYEPMWTEAADLGSRLAKQAKNLKTNSGFVNALAFNPTVYLSLLYSLRTRRYLYERFVLPNLAPRKASESNRSS